MKLLHYYYDWEGWHYSSELVIIRKVTELRGYSEGTKEFYSKLVYRLWLLRRLLDFFIDNAYIVSMKHNYT